MWAFICVIPFFRPFYDEREDEAVAQIPPLRVD